MCLSSLSFCWRLSRILNYVFSRCSSFIECVFRGLFPNFMRPFRKSNYKCLICSLYVLGGCCRFKNVFNQFSPTYISSVVFFLFSNLKYKSTLRGIFTITGARRECKKIFGSIKCCYVKGKEEKKAN